MRPTLFLLLVVCLVAGCKAEENYDYDGEPAPAATQAPARPAGRLGSLLSPRGRAPAARKPAPTTSTTVKPTEQVPEEVDEKEDVAYEDSQEPEETQTTTTEPTKKLRAGGIRPFRSNDDLLAALKRRRAQGITHAPTSTTQVFNEATTQKSKSSSGGRSRTSPLADSSSRTTSRGRFGSGTRGAKPLTEEVEETQQEEVQVKPKPYRRG